MYGHLRDIVVVVMPSCGVCSTGEVRYDALDTLNDANVIALQKVLEGSEDGGVEAVSKLKALYRSCMDLTTISSLGSAPLLQLISDVGMFGNQTFCVKWDGIEGVTVYSM